jgi:pimeloyl-ACP methyl ester carboxylesterase
MVNLKLSQRIAIKFYAAQINTTALVSPGKAAEKAFKLFCTPNIQSKRKVPEVFNRAEKLHLSVQGTQIYGWRWKQLHQTSKKILIAHGFNSYAYKFEKYVHLLLKAGFEVIAFDAPAHGKSKGKQINALLYKQMILEANKTYGNFYGIIAHSLGALAASLATEEMAQLEKLVLIAPATETKTAINNYFKLMKLKEGIKPAFEKIIASIAQKPITYFSATRAVSNISIKTLWLHDEGDRVCPYEDAVKIKDKQLHHVIFRTTTGLGHNKIYKENIIANEIINFISLT